MTLGGATASAAAAARLGEHRGRWQDKPVLRAIYGDYYDRLAARLVAGRTLELGGGPGNLKSWIAGRPGAGPVVTTDIVANPWLDAACDAQALPFADGAFANIVMVDVLHHIERPVRFLTEAVRVLRPGGRLVALEPAITPVAGLAYRFAHPEPVDMAADPLADGPLQPGRDPFDANQAVATRLAGRDRARTAHRIAGLRLMETRWLSLFAYPLSGGFRSWSLIPAGLVPAALAMERWLEPWLGRLAGFRLLLVYERTP